MEVSVEEGELPGAGELPAEGESGIARGRAIVVKIQWLMGDLQVAMRGIQWESSIESGGRFTAGRGGRGGDVCEKVGTR